MSVAYSCILDVKTIKHSIIPLKMQNMFLSITVSICGLLWLPVGGAVAH